ncbi:MULTISPECIES: ABC transporter substrate-binding protein [unclassified Ochrobactrum]|uniref:ABC transporter substrate-binding protein n=1 Tax=unclassified Ochrobactrum TaxID=239106 RepID=UPI000DEF8A08|nr:MULTISPECIES: ABC transporter substrate-binding protein [unclassified Ochrobactrum]MBQ0709933.1 amino acid ABC transporter substrate-binding protein [Ochrobactrum sp. AP1BH01-1]
MPDYIHFMGKNTLKSALLAATFAVGALAPHGTAAAPLTVKENTLSVGSDLTYPPFVYMKDGKPAGFDVELMKGVAKQLGLAAEFKDTRFTSLITGVRANHFDVIASALYVTPERQKILNFIPYIKAGSSLLVLKGAKFRPSNEKELCGKIVGSMQGASWLPKLKALSENYCAKNNLGAIETREFDTDAQVTQALRSGSVDVEFMDNVVAAELLKKFPDDYAVTSSGLIYPIMVGVATTPQNKELFNAMNDALAEMRKDGSYDALVKAYGMEPVSEDEIKSVVATAQ